MWQWYESVALFFYILMLIFSILMIIGFYICDGKTCKAFCDASHQGPLGTKQNVLKVLELLGSDGMWGFPYIGATIISFFFIWLLPAPWTMVNFAKIFFISFLVIYALFSFYNHHYVTPIKNYVGDYIEQHSDDSVMYTNTLSTIHHMDHDPSNINNITHIYPLSFDKPLPITPINKINNKF